MNKSSFSFSRLLLQLKASAELIFWLAALFALFFMDVNSNTPSLCIFRFIGFNSCPGCGIGHAIHHALHLNFSQSFSDHIFGIPAVLIIFHRIGQLIFTPKQYST